MRLACLLAAAILPFTAASAAAAEIPCGPVDADVIRVDGLLEDWGDVPPLQLADARRDFSVDLRCNYDRTTLYLAIDVHDNYLVRTRAAHPNEDHVEIAFAPLGATKVERLVVLPGDGKLPRKAYWSSGRPLHGVELADALQPGGYAVELRIALASVPGWSPGAPAIRLGVAAFDCASKASPKIESTLATSPLDEPRHLSTIEFAEGKGALEAFLRDRKLPPSAVTFDRIGRVLPSGSARVVLAGKTLGVISDEYTYLELPVASPSDVLDMRLVDLAGDRHDAMVVRYRERAGAATREVLAAYRMVDEGLRRTFGVEVGKTLGANRLSSNVLFVKRRAATDIVVEPLPAVGWNEATYRESPDEDLVPILLPWGKERRARFQFKGADYLRAE
jgi:hypothetical protein